MKEVIIEIHSGCAEVTYKSKDVKVIIKDFDNEDGEAQEFIYEPNWEISE